MNISAIHSRLFYKRALVTNNLNACYSSSYSSNPVKINQQPNADTVSFKRTPECIGSPFVHDPRELELHCACCNRKMLKNSTVQNFMNKEVYYPAYVALDRIKDEQNFRLHEQSPAMQKVYSFIKNEANNYKSLNLEQLVLKERVINYKKTASKEQIQALNELRARCQEVAHDISHIVEKLDELQPDFQPTEETVFQDLKRYAKIYPTETIKEIINKPEIKTEYLTKLQQKQNSKLSKIEYLIEELSPEYAIKAEKALSDSYQIFNNESTNILHKRQRVIDLFESVLGTIPPEMVTDKRIASQIMKRLEDLPDSKNDTNAFMIKYAPRSANSITEVLVKRLRNTKEHVKPHHREGDSGESNKKNYIYLCGKCNHERMTQKYDEFIKKHPQMPENTQKQIDEICDYINKGILEGYDTWPNDIKEPLGDESEGLIVIDSSKLNLSEAKANRTEKMAAYIEEQKKKAEQNTLATGPYRRHGKKK